MSHEPRASALAFASAGCPGIGGAIRSEPADFDVTEIPSYPTSGAGEHVYVELVRAGRSTPDVAKELARAFGIAARDIGYAGLKDKVARVTQTFSLPLARASTADVARRVAGELGVEVLACARHANKLKRGHLAGNRFRILVRGVEADALERTRAIAAVLARTGVPNYFGAQRAGARGTNAARGRELLFAGSDARALRRAWAGQLLVSAWQAELFNTWLAARIERGELAHLLLGDVALKRANGALFEVVDVEAETPRFLAREIAASGPMFGAAMLGASGAPGERERALLASSGVSLEVLSRARVHGARRAAAVFPDELAWSSAPAGLLLTFTLARGSFATALLREVMKPEVELALVPELDG